MVDVAELFKAGDNALTQLNGDGDFRSPECVNLLDEADIVVTNPPFSLFREFVSLIVEHQKNFVIIGNQNAISYEETFRFLYKGIIIKHNKTEPTYTKTSLFLCEKRRFLWPGLRKEGNLFKLAGPGGLAFFHLTKKEVSKWPMKK